MCDMKCTTSPPCSLHSRFSVALSHFTVFAIFPISFSLSPLPFSLSSTFLPISRFYRSNGIYFKFHRLWFPSIFLWKGNQHLVVHFTAIMTLCLEIGTNPMNGTIAMYSAIILGSIGFLPNINEKAASGEKSENESEKTAKTGNDQRTVEESNTSITLKIETFCETITIQRQWTLHRR